MKQKHETDLWLPANWPAPEWIIAGTTTRTGGFSKTPYQSLNLATHVGDNINHVERNRKLVSDHLAMPSEPLWLTQEHGNIIVEPDNSTDNIKADGVYTRKEDLICVILTADCLPLLLCDRSGSEIAAIHIGWRGLGKNIIKIAVNKFTCDSRRILAWLGPCIETVHYEIDHNVYNWINSTLPGNEKFFTVTRKGHWLMDLCGIITRELKLLGIIHIHHSDYCTFSGATRFYSHRREGVTGRMASMIWIDSHSHLD